MKFAVVAFIYLFTVLIFSKELEKVSLQLHWKYQFESAGFIAAKEKGFYKDAGLDVEIRELKNGINVEKEVLSNRATYGVYGSSILLSYMRGKPLKLLASFFKRSAAVLVVNININSPKDLVGKKIMAGGKQDFDLRFKYMFNAVGVNTDDLILVKHTYNVNDFADGKVDAISAFISDEPHKLDEMYIAYNILDPSDYGVYNLLLELFTSEKEALEHSERTQRFKEASIKGWEYALAHKEEIIKIIMKKYRPDLNYKTLYLEAKSIEKLILPFAYEVGSIDKNFLKRQMELFAKDYNIKNYRKLEDFIFDNKKFYEKFDYALFWKVIGIIVFIIFLLLYYQELLRKKVRERTRELEEKNSTLQKEIIRRTEIEKKLSKAKEIAEESSKAKTQFLAAISHELRTPMNAILTYSVMGMKKMETLERERLYKYFNNINKSGSRLLDLLEDLLRIAKLESGNLEYEFKKNDLIKLLNEIINEFEVFTEEKNIKIIFGFPDKCEFDFDYKRLKQVFLNILSNAVKFSPYGCEIFITVEKENDFVTVSFKDKGPGIDKKDINLIFNSFTQGSRTKEKAQKGAGLGLAIAQKITEAHNGEIWVLNNKDEKGATFFIRLPIK